jgi:hypothetical protein
MWKCLGRAHVLANRGVKPVVFLTSHLPKRGSEGHIALRAAGPKAFFDAVEMLSDSGRARLEEYAKGGYRQPLAGFWTSEEIAPGP